MDDRDAQIRALQCRMAELERRLEAPRVEHHREWATPSNAGYHHDFGDNNYYEDKVPSAPGYRGNKESSAIYTVALLKLKMSFFLGV